MKPSLAPFTGARLLGGGGREKLYCRYRSLLSWFVQTIGELQNIACKTLFGGGGGWFKVVASMLETFVSDLTATGRIVWQLEGFSWTIMGGTATARGFILCLTVLCLHTWGSFQSCIPHWPSAPRRILCAVAEDPGCTSSSGPQICSVTNCSSRRTESTRTHTKKKKKNSLNSLWLFFWERREEKEKERKKKRKKTFRVGGFCSGVLADNSVSGESFLGGLPSTTCLSGVVAGMSRVSEGYLLTTA